MKSSIFHSLSPLCVAIAVAGGSLLAAGANAAIPDPCKLITVTEMQQIVGPLSGAPRASDPATGQVTCSYEPAKGPSYIDINLHDGELSAWKSRNGGKNPVSLPEFGKDSFVNPDSDGSTELFAKKGNLILHVSLPSGPTAVATAKAIAKKALTRL